jgi:putative ATPase
MADVEAGLGRECPKHLQSPLFKGYKYPHSYPNHYIEQQYLPDDLAGRKYYEYGENKTELAAKDYADRIKGKKT